MRAHMTPERRGEFYRQHRDGVTDPQIAERYGVSRECVRYWCRRQGDGGSCQSHYWRPTRGALSTFDTHLRESILQLRYKHPRWGPTRIRHRLAKMYPDLRLPSSASIGRYLHQWLEFRRAGKNQKSATQRPAQVTEVHQCWQVDFKLGIALRDGTLVNLCVICDQMGHACLRAAVLPTQIVGGKVARVTEAALRGVWRSCFSEWATLPDELQTDGEAVFVGQVQDAFPSRFTLWLTGLGVRHRVIRSRQPTDNAEVERFHRTLTDYAIVGSEGLAVSALQAELDRAVYEHLYELPSRAKGCGGKPPLEAYPALLDVRCRFRPEQELAYFDLSRVDAYLASYTWQRKVGHAGQITLGGQHAYYSVGRQYAGQTVQVRFDPANRHFVFYDADERQLGQRPANNLDTATITSLALWPSGLVPKQLPLPCFEGVNC